MHELGHIYLKHTTPDISCINIDTRSVNKEVDPKTEKREKAADDFDWNHSHKTFEKGVVHVHVCRQNKNGKWVRSDKPRYMNDDEIKTIIGFSPY